MQSVEGYGALPMDLHVSPQGYHPYYRKGVADDAAGQVAVHSRCLQSWAPVQSENILEMRKEKSRDAARSRRGKENYEFYELAKMLPLPAAITSQLDKASIIRLSISYLKLRDFTGHGDPPWSREGPPNKTIKGGPVRPRSMTTASLELFEQHQGTHILQSLDGFAFGLASDGRFLYISETVSIYLGLSQVEMTGSSVFDYIHQQDHAEMAEQLGINLSQSQPLSSPGSVASDDGSSTAGGGGPSTPTGLDRPAPVMTFNNTSPYKGLGRSFCVRMKSTLTKRGCHFKSSGYRVMLVLCHFRPQYTFSHNRKTPPTLMGMVALAIALPPPSVNEIRLESDMFVTRLTFEFRIAHCEPRVSELLDYTAEEITGKNMYTLCHGQDVQKMRKCHIDLIQKGQVMSAYYRLMNKNGGYTWVQTCATVICNTKNSEEQTIICVNYVLSGIEYKNYVMDCCQFSQANELKPDDPHNSEQDSAHDKEGQEDKTAHEDEPKTSPKTTGGRERGHSKPQHVRQQENCRPHPSEVCEQPKSLEITVDGLSYADEKQNHRVRKRKLTGDSLPERRGSPASSLAPSPAEYMDSKTSPDRTSPGTGDKPPPEDATVVDDDQRRWRRPGSSYGDAMSVKDLEDVMNKHLPTSGQDGLVGRSAATQRATIQWIGGGGQATLPASSLLRQLYVSRESVIRSGSHVVSRPTYYSEVQGTTLPTPPGSGGEYGPPLDAAPYGVYTGSASGYMDTYSAMTPPASVSPRDKFHSAGIAETAAFSEAASAAAAAAIPHMRHYVADPLQHGLPLKPQVFVHPGVESAYGQTTNEQQQQLYASSFHLYHPKASAHHHHHNGGTAWYPQPNS